MIKKPIDGDALEELELDEVELELDEVGLALVSVGSSSSPSLSTSVGSPSGPIMTGGYPAGGGTIPSSPASSRGMTTSAAPSGSNQTGRIVGLSKTFMMVLDIEPCFPWILWNVFVSNLAFSVRVCSGMDTAGG
jgi:hypothetical protein